MRNLNHVTYVLPSNAHLWDKMVLESESYTPTNALLYTIKY